MSLAASIKIVNQQAKKLHGADISIVVARAIAFGNDDNLVIISGTNHAKAALDFAKTVENCTITEEFHPEMDWGDGDISPAYTNSHVQF